MYAGLGAGAPRWGAFFVVHGVAVLGERALFGRAGGARRRLLAFAVLWVSVSALFIAPVLENERMPRLLFELGTSARIASDAAVLVRAAVGGRG